MAKVNLTAKKLVALKPKDKRIYYFDSNLPGFCVGVTSNGVKSFSVMYRNKLGRLRRYTIGTHPPLTLADAREAAREALRSAGKGEDPAAKKKEKREAEIKTFGDLAAAFMERYSKKKKRSWREDQRIIDTYLRRFKNVPIDDVKRADVRSMLDSLGERVIANRVLACIRKIYNWAIGVDLVENNPCFKVPRPAQEKRRDRVLSESEVKAVWRAFDKEPVLMSAMFKLRFLTVQRGGEVASMRWADVNKEGEETWWTIPGGIAKNKLPHRVPLTDGAVRILDVLRKKQLKLKNETKRKSPYVFYAPRGTGHIDELQKSAQRIRANAKELLGISKKEMFDFKAHDLRRTAASYMTSMGISRLVVGRILNHAEPGVTAVYDRHSYDSEKREALEKWAKRLTMIVSDLKVVKNAQS